MGEAKFTPVSMGGSQVGMNKDVKYVPALPEGLSSAGWSIHGGKFSPKDTYNPRLGYTPTWSLNNINPQHPYREYTLDWWTDTAIFRYDSLLVSAFYGLSIWEFRDFYKIPRKNFLFFADSGGFQADTQGVEVNPVAVLKWMEYNADVGMTLDLPAPVVQKLSESSLEYKIWEDAADRSYRDYAAMHRARQSDKLQLLKVMHGDSIGHIEMWYKKMADLEFDGIAVSPHPTNEKGIAYHLAEAALHDEKIVHCFLGTGMNTLPIHMYAKKYFKRLTFDSASFSLQGAKFRSFVYPFNPGKALEFGASYHSTLKRLPCSCPVCSITTPEIMNIDIASERDAKRRSLPGGLLALHNLHAWLVYIDFLDALADSRDDYMAYLKSECPPETTRAIEFIDLAMEKGIEVAQRLIYEEDSTRNVNGMFV